MKVLELSPRNAAIDLLTVRPVGTINKSAEENAKGGYEAQAFALVQSCIAIAKSEGNQWLRIVSKLADMETAGRKAFRAGLDAHKKEMSEHVKASGDDPVFTGAKSSAIVRFSQLKTVSRAMDAGWQPEAKLDDMGKVARHPADNSLILVDGFYACWAQAHTHLKSQGTSDTRGRPAKTFTEKLAKFLKDNKASDGDLAEALVMLEVFAEAVSPEN